MNTYKNFSIGEAFKFGFNKTFENIGEFVKMALITTGLSIATVLLPGIFMGYKTLGSIIVNPTMVDSTSTTLRMTDSLLSTASLFFSFLYIIWFLIYTFYGYQLTRYSLLVAEHKTDQWQGYFDAQPKLFWKYLLARLWYSIKFIFAFLVSFFLLGAFGWYIWTKYLFTAYPILDRTAHTVGEDVRYNRELTRGILPKLFGFLVILCLIAGILGGLMGLTFIFLFTHGWLGQVATQAFTLILNMFFTPIIMLAFVYIYKQLDRYKTAQHHIDESETHPRHT